MCCEPLCQHPWSSSLHLAACSAKGWDVVLIPLTFFCVLVSQNTEEQPTYQQTPPHSDSKSSQHRNDRFISEHDHEGKIQAATLPRTHSTRQRGVHDSDRETFKWWVVNTTETKVRGSIVESLGLAVAVPYDISTTPPTPPPKEHDPVASIVL